MIPFEIDWWPKRVLYAEGAIDGLAGVLKDLKRTRALVVCGKSVAAGETFAHVRQALGGAYAGAFQEIKMHAHLPDVARAANLAKELGADTIISLGGGSAIDSGKGICLSHKVGGGIADYALKPGTSTGADETPFPKLDLAHIAIPTTTGSGSEITPTGGFFDPSLGHKRIYRHENLIPDVAVLDPLATVATPARLTACSGMTAVARCVESLYAGRRNPFRTGLALHGLRMLIASLPVTIDTPGDIEARSNCLVASSMSAISANVNTSALHAVGHVVGGSRGLQHGVAHTILLPGALRVMGPTLGDLQKQLVWAFGECPDGLTADQAGQRAADLMAEFVARLPLPQTLRDVGVERDALPGMAEHAARDPILLRSGAKVGADRILQMLEAAF